MCLLFFLFIPSITHTAFSFITTILQWQLGHKIAHKNNCKNCTISSPNHHALFYSVCCLDWKKTLFILLSMCKKAGITVYFWWENVKNIKNMWRLFLFCCIVRLPRIRKLHNCILLFFTRLPLFLKEIRFLYNSKGVSVKKVEESHKTMSLS